MAWFSFLSGAAGLAKGLAGIDLVSPARNEFMAEQAQDLLSLHDPRQGWKFVYASPAFKRLTGYAPEEFLGRTGEEFLHPDDVEKLRQSRGAFAGGGDATISVECRLRTKAGSWRWLEIVKTPRPGVNPRGRVLVIARDISERKANAEHIHALAFRDFTTGLPNRAAFLEHLETLMAGRARGARALALSYIEIGSLKSLYASHGHRAGDALLREAAARLSRYCGEHSYVARLGDDAFVALTEEAGGMLLEAPQLVAGMVDDLSRAFVVNGEPVYVTVFAGLAVAPLHVRTGDGLLAAAASAAGAAKASGRNGWRVFQSEYSAIEQRRNRAQVELRQAYEQNRLVLYYQPKMDIKTSRCVGFEALLRLRTDHGVLCPSELIAAAEESGFIHPLTQWVIRTAMAQSRAWRDSGLRAPIAVNISAKSLHNDGTGFIRLIEQALAEDSELPRYLELEITESVFAADGRRFIDVLRRLRELGFRLHIDDFGTGFSSLSYLRALPFHTIKVDRAFVDGLPQAHTEILEAIITIARSLGMAVIAEGVETLEQLACLQSVGCTLGQGYLFASPMTANDAASFARAAAWADEDSRCGGHR